MRQPQQGANLLNLSKTPSLSGVLAASALLVGILGAPLIWAQRTNAQTEFEVASVKARPSSATSYSGEAGGPGTTDPGRITWSGAALKWLLATAYDVKSYQISGPAWLDSEGYVIVAKVPEGATKEQVKVMWQNLLKDRFGVVVHHESRVVQADEMTLAKGASKLKETGLYGPDDLLDRYMTAPGLIVAGDGGNRRILGRAQSMAQVASVLAQVVDHPVIDETGLTGKYDFDIELDLNQPPAPGDNANQPSPNGTVNYVSCRSCAIASALEQGLGVKLVKSSVQLDVIVVDHAEKIPTEN